uniref:Ig-like domain-containing protein n=1 Tax=Periophthalmus magnuspinnatus TaxID=409849 RepID=A0A3B4AXQ5_9GOBI
MRQNIRNEKRMIIAYAICILSKPDLERLIHDNATLQCNCQDVNIVICYWYKQAFGQIPVKITSYNKYESKGELNHIFKVKKRFRLNNKDNYNNLEIKDLLVSDAATYFCMSSNLYKLDFLESITLDIEGAGLNFTTLDYELTSENSSIQRGLESAPLDCSFNNGICDKEHQVYWFSHNYESAKGIIYSHGGSSNQCESNMDISSKSCIYNLPVHNDHATSNWTKCAVASCGKLLFGTKSKSDSEDRYMPSVLVSILSGALVGTLILSVLLSMLYCSFLFCQNEEDIHYAALNHHTSSRSIRHGDSTNTECVYSGVRL